MYVTITYETCYTSTCTITSITLVLLKLPSCNIGEVVRPAIFGLDKVAIGCCYIVELSVAGIQHGVKVTCVLCDVGLYWLKERLQNVDIYLTLTPRLSNFSLSVCKQQQKSHVCSVYYSRV